jgi:hypothetical protein
MEANCIAIFETQNAIKISLLSIHDDLNYFLNPIKIVVYVPVLAPTLDSKVLQKNTHSVAG